MTGNLLLQNVRPMGGDAVDVLVRKGVIVAMAAGIEAEGGTAVFDGQNQLLLPGLVNAHAHIDKNLLGWPWHKNQVPGPRIRDYVDNERQVRRDMGLSAQVQSAREVEASLALGTTHIRTHVDIDTEAGLAHFEGVTATREAYREVMTMQTVAFPQSGMLIRPGTVALLEEAVKLGADAIGGLDPSTVDRDPVKHLDIIFDIAGRYGVELDIHLHEPGTLGAFAVELIAERTKVLGLQGKVTISHVFCLGQVEESYLNQLIDLLLENRITIMSLGSGRADFPPLKRLYEAGVPLCTGTDGVRDTWGPFNQIDLLDRVRLLGYRSGLRKDEDVEMLLDIATYGGARLMGDADYGLAVGKRADLLLLPADTPTEAAAVRPVRTLVVKNGRVVGENGRFVGIRD
ncbi:MAG: amidohydrolase family protein [Chloroflexota bacterium]